MTDHRKIEQIASDWIVRRSNPDGSWSSEDQCALEAWLAESTAHKVAFVRLDVAWQRANKIRTLAGNAPSGAVPQVGAWQQSPFFARRLDAIEASPSQQAPQNLKTLEFKPRGSQHKKSAALRRIAAVLVAGLGMSALVGGWYATGREEQSFLTPLGVTRQEAIQDGSKATLSSDSEVLVSLSRSSRDIDLRRGEAYFEVAKDASRPFVVNAGGTTATAIGTKFSVRRDSDVVRLVVTEGTVRLAPSIAGNKMPTATFTAGAIALVTKDGIRIESRSPEQASEAVGWLSGDVVFHGTPLREAIVDFNRFNTHKLVIMDPKAGEIRVDGSFKVGNAAGFSRLISQVFPVEVVQKQDVSEIYMRERIFFADAVGVFAVGGRLHQEAQVSRLPPGEIGLMKKVLLRASLLALSCSLSVAALAQSRSASQVSIPAGDLANNIELLRKQTGVEVIYNASELRGSPSKGISGSYSGEDALKRLLAGSGFTLKVDASGAYAISKSPRPTNTPKPAAKKKINDASQSQAGGERGEITNLPEMLVQGERIWSLNADIRRTEDDPQPYVIFEREEIERSGATTLEDFIRERLPMNTTGSALYQAPGAIAGNASSVNLRGLGTGQTLILVDGRRLPDFSIGNSTTQPSINGIPVGAVERVEVLPTTAGGIYGGSATGGVINIILRRDYQGAEVKFTYGNTFDTDTANRRIDISSGTNFNDGRTNVLLAATVSEANELLIGDREFARRGREQILQNNPGFFLNAASPLTSATPNIRSATGTPLILDNGTSLGSAITFIPVGYQGTSSDGGQALIANAGNYNFDLAPTAGVLTNGSRYSLAKGPRNYSVMGTVRHAFSPNVSGFVDAAFSQTSTRAAYATAAATAFTINAAAPNNPFQQAIVVSLPTQAFDDVYKTDTKQERVSAGLVVSLPGSWQASVDIGWNRSELDNFATRAILPTFVTAVRTGQVDILRDTLAYPLDVSSFLGPRTSTENVPSTLKSGTARVGGPLFNLPGGPVNATVQFEHREMNVGQSVQNYLGQVSEIFPEKNQQVQSLYAELRAPIVSEANAVPGIRELELQLAGRRDEYTTRAGQRRYSFDTPLVEQEATLSSTNPTIALRYVPFESLALRASYGKGFMPPTIDQVTSSPFNSVLTVQDIRRGGETVSTLWRNFGGTVDLEPEESESWSAGFVFSPTWLPGLRLSADYTNIKKTNNIYQTFNGQFFVDNEEKFPYTVIREAPAAGDPFGVGRIIAIDTLLVNIARAEVEAVDLQLNYGFSTDWGSFDFYSLATWQTHYRTQVSPESPVVENVGITKDNPLKLRLNAGITWSLGNWSAGWAARYFDSYVVSTSPTTIANQGSLRVPSQNYHDLFLGYKTDAGNSWASGLELQLGFKNVLDKAPPFDAASFPYYSTYGDPYMASYYMSVKKSF